MPALFVSTRLSGGTSSTSLPRKLSHALRFRRLRSATSSPSMPGRLAGNTIPSPPTGVLSAYRSALRQSIFLTCRVDINGFSSEFFLKSLFNFEPPLRARAMPRWSLEDLLFYLSSSTFKPLRSAPFSRVLQKALCLTQWAGLGGQEEIGFCRVLDTII